MFNSTDICFNGVLVLTKANIFEFTFEKYTFDK